MEMYASQEMRGQPDTLQQLIAQFKIMHGSAADQKSPAPSGLSSKVDTGYTITEYDTPREDWRTSNNAPNA